MFIEFHNSNLYHIATKDNKDTLCSLVFSLATENQSEYAETNYPMPHIVDIPSPNRKLCKKCSEKNNQ